MTKEIKNKMIRLPDGSFMPKLGQGTWQMGEDDQKKEKEIAGLEYGIRLGLHLLDSAEMYADGKAEMIAGEAVKSFKRSDLYLVSKVYPQNACKAHIYSSLERSLKLLGTDYLDLYLLHWRGDADLSETVYLMEELKNKGKIRRWGVSNFDVADMEDLWKVPDGRNCCVNQILYNLGSRGIELICCSGSGKNMYRLWPIHRWGQAGALVTQDGVSKEALMKDINVLEVARRHGISVVQLLLAFVLRLEDMAAIPKAVSPAHIDENAAALDIVLTEEDIDQLSASFPRQRRRCRWKNIDRTVCFFARTAFRISERGALFLCIDLNVFRRYPAQQAKIFLETVRVLSHNINIGFSPPDMDKTVRMS